MFLLNNLKWPSSPLLLDVALLMDFLTLRNRDEAAEGDEHGGSEAGDIFPPACPFRSPCSNSLISDDDEEEMEEKMLLRRRLRFSESSDDGCCASGRGSESPCFWFASSSASSSDGCVRKKAFDSAGRRHGARRNSAGEAGGLQTKGWFLGRQF